jgi:DNA-binding IclR family transcriptional regulator
MQLPATRGLERRNVAQRQALVHRLISEFEEMPGLRLTLAQACRLFGLPEAAALRILTELTDRGTLQRSPSDFYMRRERG